MNLWIVVPAYLTFCLIILAPCMLSSRLSRKEETQDRQ